eukprot:sb/3467329/
MVKDKRIKKGDAISAPKPAQNPSGGADDVSDERVENMGADELKTELEKMMDDMNVPDQKRTPIRKMTTALQKNMLSNHYKSLKENVVAEPAENADGPKRGTPEYFTHELRKEMDKDTSRKALEALRVSLQSYTISWLKNFGKDNGLELLLNWLKKSQERDYCEVTHECVKCLKVFMNNKYGLMSMMKNKEGMLLLTKCLDPRNHVMMTEVLRILAAVSYVSDEGHQAVLEALSSYGEQTGRPRFQVLVDNLKAEHAPQQLTIGILTNRSREKTRGTKVISVLALPYIKNTVMRNTNYPII